jgi:hypothetical protein
MKEAKFNVVFVSRPAASPATLNAFAMGHLSAAPNLAAKLGVDLENVTLQARTTSGDVVEIRLERVKALDS